MKSDEKRPLSSAERRQLLRTALVARDSGVSAKALLCLFVKSRGSPMAAPLDSEDDVSSWMTTFEQSDRPAML